MVGIIDIGSNTIRLVTYENGNKLLDIGLRSDILKDSINGILSDSGIEKLCKSIEFLCSKARDSKIFIIATAAVRELLNKEEVENIIFKRTGIKMHILSGEEEAECVFLGVIGKIEEEEGILVDLGGGSVEIIEFKERKIIFKASYPLGCKVIKNRLVKNNIPNIDEINNINIVLREKIRNNPVGGNIYFIGGTAKTALKIKNSIFNKKEEKIKIEEIKRILDYIYSLTEKELTEEFKNRYDTIYTGIIIMKIIAEIYEKNEIFISQNSIRDGYLIKEMEI